ncbi:DNA-3-methyladenine glycosylase family protein [Actinomadura rubrisoli]|uniref:DNA-3-methyladenine glycosylase family protein n=1 Tax=Actinomadura rubrisoli TaxID=2530368 RepID=UPI001A9D84B8|nr:DNA-3-methyladenine glycosylase 2 family protein [Actinomadura rubrisoli]
MAINLTHSEIITLRPAQPFHFDGTFRKSSHFPVPFRHHEPGKYWQTLTWDGEVLGIRMTTGGTGENPEIELTVYSGHRLPESVLDGVVAELTARFDLDADLRPFVDGLAGEPVLGAAIGRWAGMRVSSSYSLYEFLAVAVVLQNTTVRRSAQMLAALFEEFGTRVAFDGRELFAFWRPGAVAGAGEQRLRELKLGYRAKTLHRIAEAFEAGTVDETAIRALPPSERRRRLLQIYGVGPASVSYLLFEVFHHYDAFDTLPPWEQKIYSRLLFDEERVPAEKILAEAAHRWGEWRMLAAHYLFEDLFWRHAREEIPWLRALIRL